MSKKKVRENFRNEVFKRDGFKCKICGRNDTKLDAHHITDRHDMPCGGYVKENGITLCDLGEIGCHFKAEQYNLGKKPPNGYMPDDLYKIIKSSYEIAVVESLKLEE
jgi:hypothetical protein